MTSSKVRPQKVVIEMTSQNISVLSSRPSKFLIAPLYSCL